MKFTVLNGSPKGNELSGTMQYFYFMQKKVPGHEYEYFEIAKDIQKIENDKSELERILKSVEKCDAVIWSMPVYYFLVPSQVKRLIEIIFERKKMKSFSGKYATLILSSAQVMDHTAHNYMHEICEDFGMKFYRGFSVVATELQGEQCRESVKNFYMNFIAAVQRREPIQRRSNPISCKKIRYKNSVIKKEKKHTDKKILLLTDHTSGSNLEQMIMTYCESSKYDVEVVNINSDINIKGPCRGCMKCIFEAECVQKDDMKMLFDEKMKPADAIVFAGTIVDRYLSSQWKRFWDRNYFLGHRPLYAWKESAFIISGPLRQEPNIRQIFEGLLPLALCELAGIVTDEGKDNATTCSFIKNLAETVDRRLEKGPVYQQNFLSKGSHALIRDTIFAFSGCMSEDHKYFKKYGLYDFPQRWTKDRIANIMFKIFMYIPPLRNKIKKDFLKLMIMSLTMILKKEK